jgi:hypothetical protein
MPAALRILNQPSSRGLAATVTRSSCMIGDRRRAAHRATIARHDRRRRSRLRFPCAPRRCSTGFIPSRVKDFAGTLERALKDAVTEAGILLAHSSAGGAADGERALPVTTIDSQAGGGTWMPERTISTSSPLLSSCHQRHHPAVDLRANAGVADIGVNGIGKIDRRGAPAAARSA